MKKTSQKRRARKMPPWGTAASSGERATRREGEVQGDRHPNKSDKAGARAVKDTPLERAQRGGRKDKFFSGKARFPTLLKETGRTSRLMVPDLVSEEGHGTPGYPRCRGLKRGSGSRSRRSG